MKIQFLILWNYTSSTNNIFSLIETLILLLEKYYNLQYMQFECCSDNNVLSLDFNRFVILSLNLVL